MPTTPYAKVLASINGGALTSGPITVTAGQTCQLSAESTVGWSSARWEIYSFPTGWSTPAGWTLDATSQVLYYVGTTPPVFTVPSTTYWGKFLLSLTVNGGVQIINGKTVSVPTLVDNTTALSLLSPQGFTGIGFGEEDQFGTRGYQTALETNFRLASTSAGDTSSAFYAKDYGATGDGTTDDASAINAALTAAAISGGHVVIGPGTFIVGAQLTIPGNNVSVSGSGSATVIKAKAATDFQYVVYATGRTGLTVSDLVIDANQTNRSGALTTRSCALVFDACTDCLVTRIIVKNTIGKSPVSAVGAAFGSTCVRCTFSECTAVDCGNGANVSDGFFVNGTQCLVSACIAKSCLDTGFVIESSNYSGVVGCTSYSCGAGAAITNATNAAVYGNFIDGLSVYDWNATVTGGIQIGNPSAGTTGDLNSTVVSNVIMKVAAGTGPAINVRETGTAKTNYLKLANIRIDGATIQGILAQAYYLDIVNCTIATTGTCVQLGSGVHHATISHCQLYPAGTFGIVTIGDNDKIRIIDNMIDGGGVASYAIYTAGTSTNIDTSTNAYHACAIQYVVADDGTSPYSPFQYVGSASVPTTGLWTYGQVVTNTSPAAGGTPGWVCTTGGYMTTVAWAGTTAYAEGDKVNAGSKSYKCTVAGTSSGVAPSHSTGTATDGTVTWLYLGPLAVFRAMANLA